MNYTSTATIQSVTGKGLLDGNGQAAYDYFYTNKTYKRPTLHYITGGSHITIKNLQIKTQPNVFFSAAGGTTNIEYSGLNLTAVSNSTAPPKNTDGFDIGTATYVTLKKIIVFNNDDCIAFKPGANHVTVDTISWTGSHGISVGSLGSKAGTIDTVTNIHVTSATMINANKAVGIKLYPGGSAYGSAVVRNVTFNHVNVIDIEFGAQILNCYSSNKTYCASNPGAASVTDVYVTNFQGKTNSKYAPNLANFDLPANGVCDLSFFSWSVVPTSGSATFPCANIDHSTGLNCTSGASG